MNKSKILSSILLPLAASCSLLQFSSAAPTPEDNCNVKRETIDSDWREHICVRGSGEESYDIKPSEGAPIEDKDSYDVVVVGSGLAGLSASVYLTDHKKRVLLLEKSSGFGGLASGARDDESDNGEKGANEEVTFGRGAAYWTKAYEEEQAILDHIHLGNFLKENPIPEPIDSYLFNGHLYKGVWDDETMDQLPPSFRVFHFQLQYADIMKQIPDQPIEDADDWHDGSSLYLDTMSTKTWLEQMPSNIKKHLDELVVKFQKAKTKKEREYIDSTIKDGQKALEGWLHAGLVEKVDPVGMKDIVDFLNLYCRSALGTTSESVSAVAFANFYISEIDTRYTSTTGTGEAASHMVDMLKARTDLIEMKDRSPVLSIENTKTGVVVLYNGKKITHSVRAKYAVFAGQIGFAPKVVIGLKDEAPEQAAVMSGLGYAHYSVHNVVVEGHPYRSSYDTWMKNDKSTLADPTDVILGLWMNKDMQGYAGYRDFSKEPPLPHGEFTIYNPMPLTINGTGYTKDEVIKAAIDSVGYLDSSFGTLPDKSDWRGPIEGKIIKVITNRWPFSAHIAKPYHFITEAKIMRQPFKHVYFANNNLGTPAFEEALYRGHCAALNVLGRLRGKFTHEEWSRCTNYTK
jgi:NAD(P)-binding Rossmann-like domain